MADIAELHRARSSSTSARSRTESLGACPNGDGEIRENRAAFGCSSYKSKSEPGCGFTIWKNQGGFTITREAVAELLAYGEGALDGGGARWCWTTRSSADRRRGRQAADPVARRSGRAPTATARSRRTARPSAAPPTRARRIRAAASRSGRTRPASRSPPTRCASCWSPARPSCEGPQPARLVLAEGNKPQIVDEQGKPLRARSAPAPTATARSRRTAAASAARRGRASPSRAAASRSGRASAGSLVTAARCASCSSTARPS